MIKRKVYLLLENLDQLGNLNIGFVRVLLILIDIYSSLVLKPNFTCCNSFALSSVVKVTTGI